MEVAPTTIKDTMKNNFKLEDSLGYVIGRAARSVGGLLNRNMAACGHDVTCEQWSVLFNLSQQDGQKQQDLAQHTCKDKTSMTRLIDGMERRNLVVRIPDRKDKRQKLIYLTNKGKSLQQDLMRIVKQTLAQAETGISPRDMNNCMKTLSLIYTNVSDIQSKPIVAPATKSKGKR